MKRLLKKAAALAAGWVAATFFFYLAALLIVSLEVLDYRVLHWSPVGLPWLLPAIVVAGVATSSWIGCRVLDGVAQVLGVAVEPVTCVGRGRKLAAYFAGVGTATVVFAVAPLLMLVAERTKSEGWESVAITWAFGVLPAMPCFALLATRAVLRGGHGSEPSAPAAGAAPAAAATPAPEPPDPPLLRIAPV